MPVFDFDEEVFDSFVLGDWDGGGVPVTIPDIARLFLHAKVTTMLYHAEGTTGESTPVSVVEELVDQDGNPIVDQNLEQIVVTVGGSAILFHAKETDTLFHAEN